jgi:hypothetical protein
MGILGIVVCLWMRESHATLATDDQMVCAGLQGV